MLITGWSWFIGYILIGLVCGFAYLFNDGYNGNEFKKDDDTVAFLGWVGLWPFGSLRAAHALGYKYKQYRKDKKANSVQRHAAKTW